jgi:hypothetical protein
LYCRGEGRSTLLDDVRIYDAAVSAEEIIVMALQIVSQKTVQ